jgi:hypothetical protein
MQHGCADNLPAIFYGAMQESTLHRCDIPEPTVNKLDMVDKGRAKVDGDRYGEVQSMDRWNLMACFSAIFPNLFLSSTPYRVNGSGNVPSLCVKRSVLRQGSAITGLNFYQYLFGG